MAVVVGVLALAAVSLAPVLIAIGAKRLARRLSPSDHWGNPNR